MTLKEKVFNALDEHNYLTDTQVYKIWGKEPNWNTAEEYKRQWRALKGLREFFTDKNIVRITKYRRGCRATLDGNKWYRITREYFEEIRPNFIRDYTRADLTTIEEYKKDTSRIL